jgi:hypothetical protein
MLTQQTMYVPLLIGLFPIIAILHLLETFMKNTVQSTTNNLTVRTCAVKKARK